MASCLDMFRGWVDSIKDKFSGSDSNPSKDGNIVIAVAGVGDLGKFICEELKKAEGLEPLVLTRNATHDWATSKSIPFKQTDYTPDSLLKILNKSKSAALISLLNIFDIDEFVSVHQNMVTACQKSKQTKRFISSEWIGDISAYPLSPPFYEKTRVPIRDILEKQSEVEYTAVCPGWLVDHFVPAKKTYMKHVPFSPVEPDAWQALVRGSGDEKVSFVLMRDVAKAMVPLLKTEKGAWESVTYIAGGWATFNEVISALEKEYGREMPRQSRSLDEIRHDKDNNEVNSLPGLSAQIEEMGVLEHFAVPEERTLQQRDKYFKDVEFRGLEDALRYAKEAEFV